MRPSREIVARGAILEDLRLLVRRGIQETAGEPKSASRTHAPIQNMTFFPHILSMGFLFLTDASQSS